MIRAPIRNNLHELEPYIAPGVVPANEGASAIATEMTRPLASAFGVSGFVVSLHFAEDAAPEVLAEWGNFVRADMAGLLREAAAACGIQPGRRGSSIEQGRLLPPDREGYATLHLSFRGDDDTTDIVFSGFFDKGSQPDAKVIAAAMRRLGPMLDAYLRLWQTHRALVIETRGLRAALDTIDLGVALFDGGGSLTYANAAAEAVLRDGTLLRRRGRTIAASSLVDTMKLQSILAQAIAGRAGAEGGSQRHKQSECELLKLACGTERLILTALPLQAASVAPGQVAAALVLLRPDADVEAAFAPICRLYGLSGVETRLVCQLMIGRSLFDAAQLLRIKEQTARSYLKQVFLKTDVNRQADLLRLLLSSLLRIRPSALPIH